MYTACCYLQSAVRQPGAAPRPHAHAQVRVGPVVAPQLLNVDDGLGRDRDHPFRRGRLRGGGLRFRRRPHGTHPEPGPRPADERQGRGGDQGRPDDERPRRPAHHDLLSIVVEWPAVEGY